MVPILTTASALAHLLVPVRAWQLGLISRVPWFLVWVATNAASFPMSWWLTQEQFGRANEFRMLGDGLVRALAFLEFSANLTAGRPGLQASMRRFNVWVLGAASLVAVLANWNALAQVNDTNSVVYSSLVMTNRFVGYSVLSFLAGLLTFASWLGLSLAGAWRVHACSMLLLLLATIVPEIGLAADLSTSMGASMTALSLPIESAALFGWVLLMRRPETVAAIPARALVEESALVARIRALGGRVSPPKRS